MTNLIDIASIPVMALHFLGCLVSLRDLRNTDFVALTYHTNRPVPPQLKVVLRLLLFTTLLILFPQIEPVYLMLKAALELVSMMM
jgi:RsiW-degrading membrane proteinase PrsW (M82 family)